MAEPVVKVRRFKTMKKPHNPFKRALSDTLRRDKRLRKGIDPKTGDLFI